MTPYRRRIIVVMVVVALVATALLAGLRLRGSGESGVSFRVMDSREVSSFLESISVSGSFSWLLGGLARPKGYIRILDSLPYTMVSPNPRPLMEGMYDVEPYNLTFYLEDVLGEKHETLYSGVYRTSYGAVIYVDIMVYGEGSRERALAIIYAGINDTAAWDRLVAGYVVLSGLGYKTVRDALLQIYGIYKYGGYRPGLVLWRIPFPSRGGRIVVDGRQIPLDALVALSMPLYPLTSSLGWLEQTVETLYWALVGQPAFSLALRLTYPPGASPRDIYVGDLPRILRAIAYPGVVYSSPGEIYETPLIMRLKGVGVCGDFSLSAMILGDSGFSAPVLKLSGRDPRTGQPHSIAVLLVPSEIYGEGVTGIDIDGDGVPDTLIKITDTAGLPWSLLEKAGFTESYILDPGPTLYSVDPPLNKGTSNWVYCFLAGYPLLYRGLPRVLRMPWSNETLGLMRQIFMEKTGEEPPSTNTYILAAWAYTRKLITPDRYYWIVNTTLETPPERVAELITGYMPVNTSLYAGLNPWCEVAAYFLEKYMGPKTTGERGVLLGGKGEYVAAEQVLGAVWRAYSGTTTIVTKNLVVVGLRPTYRNVIKDGLPLNIFTGWTSARGRTISVWLEPLNLAKYVYGSTVVLDGRVAHTTIVMPPLSDKLIKINSTYILLVQERTACPDIIVTAKIIPSYPYPTYTYYKLEHIYGTNIIVRIMGEALDRELSLSIILSGIPPVEPEMINPYVFTPNKTFTTLPYNATYNGYLNITINTGVAAPVQANTIIGVKISGNTCINIYILLPSKQIARY